jgi:hypothetical protein
VLLPVEKLDTVKRWLSGVYGDSSIPVICIIGNTAIVRLLFYDDLKSPAPRPACIGIVGVFEDELEPFKM